MADGFVSVSRHIDAPAERLFALLADSANHPLIDGSGMVRQPAPGVRLSRTGDSFLMNMHHPRWGDYQMRNEVIEYEAGRRLTWEPTRVEASQEEQEALGDPPHYRWGYELAADGPPVDHGNRGHRNAFDRVDHPLDEGLVGHAIAAGAEVSEVRDVCA